MIYEITNDELLKVFLRAPIVDSSNKEEIGLKQAFDTLFNDVWCDTFHRIVFENLKEVIQYSFGTKIVNVKLTAETNGENFIFEFLPYIEDRLIETTDHIKLLSPCALRIYNNLMEILKSKSFIEDIYTAFAVQTFDLFKDTVESYKILCKDGKEKASASGFQEYVLISLFQDECLEIEKAIKEKKKV